MIIFNTTYLVSDNSLATWQGWIKEKHISDMLASGYFSLPQVCRVIVDQPQDGTSFSVQFTTDSLETVALWNDTQGDSFRQELSQLFGTEVLYFSTFLEIME